MAPTCTETPAVPPKFIPDSMQYCLWKKEVNMWSHVTNIQCVKARKLQCLRKKSDQKPTVRRKALFGTLPMKLKKKVVGCSYGFLQTIWPFYIYMYVCMYLCMYVCMYA